VYFLSSMLTKIKYSSSLSHERQDCLNFLNEQKFKRVIDIGASANFWAADYVTHYFDINVSHVNNKIGFTGNVNFYNDWVPILQDVEQNGKFDFAICTHVLEDICNPKLTCVMLPLIAKQGFIAVPSKYAEMSRHEGQYRGYIHHRWIYNKEQDKIVAYPKVNFIEYVNEFDKLATNYDSNINGELQWYWTRDLDINFVNNDYLGPTQSHVHEYYKNLLNNN